MNLQSRILNNDNRCTAFPYLLLLQEKEEYVTKEGYGNDTKVVYIETISGDYNEAESLGALISLWNDGLDEDEKTDKWIEGDNYEKHTVGYYWKTVNVFFTDLGYQEHLEKNAHNLKEHRTFGIHAFRNDEMNHIYKTLNINN